MVACASFTLDAPWQDLATDLPLLLQSITMFCATFSFLGPRGSTSVRQSFVWLVFAKQLCGVGSLFPAALYALSCACLLLLCNYRVFSEQQLSST
jgi:hypothetical protein